MTQIRYIPDRVIDTDGISDGASIHVYQTGTTTPVDLFSDEEMTDPVTNPYVVSAGAAVPLLYYNYTGDIRLYIVSTSGSVTDEDPYIPLVTSANIPEYAATHAATRAILATKSTSSPVMLTESGRDGTFVFDTGNHVAHVTADTAKGIYIAPETDLTGASGAWVRQITALNLYINPCWFGLSILNTAAQNDAAFDAMWSCLGSRAYNVDGVAQALDPVRVPPGLYQTAGIEIATGAVIFEGSGAGYGNSTGYKATIFQCSSGAPGLIVQGTDTSGTTTKDGSTHSNGHGSILRGFGLIGPYAGVENNNHGILVRGRCTIEDMVIENFAGDGIMLLGGNSGAGPIVSDYTISTEYGGNAIGSCVRRVKIRLCRDGVHVLGNNVSASHFEQVDTFQCRRWGFNDESSIPNTYISCQTNGSGCVDAYSSIPSLVTYIGADTVSRWYGVVDTQAVGASTNAPSGDGTNNTYWYYIKDAAVDTSKAPLWASGTTYRAGGAVRASDITGKHQFINNYAEGNQGKAQIAAPAVIRDGILADWAYDNPNYARGPGAYWRMNANGRVTLNTGLELSGLVSAGASGCSFGPQSGTSTNNIINFDNTNTQTTLNFRTWAAGVSTTNGTLFCSANGLFLNAAASGVKIQFNGTLKATFGSNNLNMASGYALLLTPGTTPSGMTDGYVWYDSTALKFKKRENGVTTDLDNLSAALTPASVAATGVVTTTTGGIGYATGAGGTVTQATSKATGVTLNKLAGEITMNAAALAASTAVTFVLTNSTIAAGDRIIVNHMSGGTFGAYSTDARSAAGSATFMVRNLTAGSLSEAIVLGYTVIKSVNA